MIYKNAFKKIKKSFGRYISLLLIVLVGVGFYAGIQITAPDIHNVTHQYYSDMRLFDTKVVSTFGLTENDRLALENLDTVQKAYGTYSSDALDEDKVIRIHAIHQDVNTVNLIEGRMPQNTKEILADQRYYAINDTIRLKEKDDILLEDTFTVVGTIDSVLYIGDDYGSTTKGNGKLNSFAFVLPKTFDSDVYTEIYIHINNQTALLDNGDYDSVISELEQDIIEIKPEYIELRRQEIIDEAMVEINSNQEKLDKEKNDALRELNDVKQTLDRNENDIKEGIITLDNEEKTLNDTITKQTKEFADARVQIAEGRKELDGTLTSLGLDKNSLASSITVLEASVKALQEQLNTLPVDHPQYEIIKGQLAQTQFQLTSLKQIQDGYATLDASEKELIQGELTFDTEIQNARLAIKDGREELANGQKEINDGRIEWSKAYQEFEGEIQSAQKKIDDAIKELDDLEMPQWLLFNRRNIGSYEELDSSIEVISSIAKVFPIFFVLIALLMTSNSMSRMVFEERSEMGTFTSLGFSDGKIISTYLIYAVSAALIGVVSGFYLGSYGIPPLIFTTFSKFRIPPLELLTNNIVLLVSLFVSVTVMASVTISSCYKELRQTPASLLRPEAPKKGKTILLERIHFLWKHFSFNWKVTLRNMFRYKKRGLMTIIGVGGCTALLLVGFGLRDSMSGIAESQYGKIFKYDTMITLKETSTSYQESYKDVLSKYDIQSSLLINQSSVTALNQGETLDAYLIVPENEDLFSTYFGLYDYQSNEELDLSNGVIITEKMADTFKLDIGSTMTIHDSNYLTHTYKVAGIAENYISNFIYMNSDTYTEVFKETLEFNTLVVNRGEVSEDTFAKALIDEDFAVNVSYTKDMIQSVLDTNKSLDGIVLLIVAVASLLAIVVLYNLTSINISERTRELATLKVLGFYDSEANSYIYREAFILTLISILIGLVGGMYLHVYVISVIEGTGMLFFKTIQPLSYLYSIGITLLFSLIMQGITYRVILKINMIEALKSIE